MGDEVEVEKILSENKQSEKGEGDDGYCLEGSVVAGNALSEHDFGIAVVHVQHKVKQRQDQQISIDNEPKFPEIEPNRHVLSSTQEETQQGDPIQIHVGNSDDENQLIGACTCEIEIVTGIQKWKNRLRVAQPLHGEVVYGKFEDLQVGDELENDLNGVEGYEGGLDVGLEERK